MNNCASLAAAFSFFLLSGCAESAQDNLPYLNPKLSSQDGAVDLVHRMTLEEKAPQLVNQARAIPRLNVRAYDWWRAAKHGSTERFGNASDRKIENSARVNWQPASTRVE